MKLNNLNYKSVFLPVNEIYGIKLAFSAMAFSDYNF